MRTFLKILFFIFGGLALLTIVFPPIIILGYFLFIAPGIILTMSPTVAVYLVLIIALDEVLRFLKVPLPLLLSFVLVIGTGCLIPYQLNKPILKQVKEFASQDMPLQEELEIPDTIAIYSKSYGRYGTLCNSLCQRLLFNNAAKNVLVLTNPDVANRFSKQLWRAYSIQQGKNCSMEDIPKNAARINVKNRIASGECIVQSSASLSDVNLYFIQNKISQNKDYQDYTNLKRRVIFANYIELFKNNGENPERTYRYTKITAQPFAYPLSFGPILGAGGGNMSLNFGFFHTSKVINKSGGNYYNVLKDFKPQMEELFGDAIKPIGPISHRQIRETLNKHLDTDDSKMKTMLFNEYASRLFKGERYLKHRPNPNPSILNDADIDTLIKILQENDIQNFWDIGRIIRDQGEDKLLVLQPYIFERMIKSHDKKTVKSLARALASYSPEYLDGYREKIDNANLTQKQIGWIAEESKGKF